MYPEGAVVHFTQRLEQEQALLDRLQSRLDDARGADTVEVTVDDLQALTILVRNSVVAIEEQLQKFRLASTKTV